MCLKQVTERAVMLDAGRTEVKGFDEAASDRHGDDRHSLRKR